MATIANTKILDRLATKFTVGDGCWEWTAYRNGSGYGQVGYRGRVVGAHRVMFELMVGPIPEGLELDHLCRNRACVRPDHLEAVPHIVNCRRGNVGQACASRTHCPQGHPYGGANLYESPSGRRVCRACQASASIRYRARRKAAHGDHR